MKAIGLMSGTSMDGIDVALIETDGEAVHSFGPACAYPYSAAERHLLREAMVAGRGLTARDARGGVLALAESMITSKHADCVQAFAEANGIKLSSVDVIGFHGQTVLHRPEQQLTVQLGDGWGLSAALGVPAVYDFRAADMDSGGQGAPLVPVYHRALALRAGLPLPAAFVNIGGIANVTFVPEGPAEGLIAFDAGPGNCLIDDWALRHTGEPMDRDAKLAMAGKVDRQTLAALISHPYFKEPAPKSLDRGTFTLDADRRSEPRGRSGDAHGLHGRGYRGGGAPAARPPPNLDRDGGRGAQSSYVRRASPRAWRKHRDRGRGRLQHGFHGGPGLRLSGRAPDERASVHLRRYDGRVRAGHMRSLRQCEQPAAERGGCRGFGSVARVWLKASRRPVRAAAR